MTEENKENKTEVVNAIGVWVIRGLLIAGAVIAGIMGKSEVASTLGGMIVLSFFLL